MSLVLLERIAELENRLHQCTSPWLADDIIGHDDGELAEMIAYDFEPAICALRRQYAIARAQGWDQIPATRIAIKNVLDVIDQSTPRPQLGVVK
jgi:hypothetical protein